jgi:hypothetical protein
MGWTCDKEGEVDKYRILMGKLLRKRPHGIPRRWENSIKMDSTETGCDERRHI